MSKFTILVFLVLSPACLWLAGCSKPVAEEPINLPPTPVLSIRSSWGVVRSDILRIREEPFTKARTLTHLRRGSVMEILSRTDKKESVDERSDYWYQVSFEGVRGWVFGAYLEVLDSKARAESFAAGMQ
jgi:hypothetical protein